MSREVDVSKIQTTFTVLEPPEECVSWISHSEENGDVLCPDCGVVVNEYDEGRPLEDVERDWEALPRLLDERPDKYGFLFWECSCGMVVSVFTDCIA